MHQTNAVKINMLIYLLIREEEKWNYFSNQKYGNL